MNKLERIEALEAEIKKLKQELSEPEFEVCKNYLFENHNGKWIINFKSIDGNKVFYNWLAPLTRITEFKTNDWCSLSFYKRASTKSEVFEALKKEAEKKTKGCSKIKIKSFDDDEIYTFENYHFKLFNNVLQIWDSDGWCAFMEDGKWAEIIDEPFKVCGYEVKKEKNLDVINIGCKKISISSLCEIKLVMEVHNFKTVQFDEYKVTLEEINKILEL